MLSSETREVLEHAWSYTPHDLAIIEWNAAFLYEPTGSEDLVDLLEIANAQLLELRYYDAVLDAELDRVYDIIGAEKVGSLLFSPYKNLLRELMLTLIELSEFIRAHRDTTPRLWAATPCPAVPTRARWPSRAFASGPSRSAASTGCCSRRTACSRARWTPAGVLPSR